MATVVPPPPIRDKETSAYVWQEWFRQIRDRANQAITSVTWGGIDFTGSSISDIVSRAHNVLTSIQGGTTGEYYHLANAEFLEVQRQNDAVNTDVDLTLTDSHNTVYVTTTGKTITLPSASTARIGKSWTVVLDVVGNVTITRSGSDTISLPTTDTAIQLTVKGSSLTFKCVSSSHWVLI